jgi:hypothetical protein
VSLSDELRDPWGYIVAGTSGGMAWALLAGATSAGPAAIAIGAGVGAAVLGVKAVTGAVVNRGPRRHRVDVPVPQRPPRGTVAARWFEQAEAAVHALDDLARAAPTGPTGDAVRAAAEDADDTLLALGRVGGHVTAVERALVRVDSPGMDAEAARLEEAARRAPSYELRQEVERSAAAVRDRVEVRDRLRAARDTLLARMQSTTLGLEGLVARLAEVLAMTATTGGSDTSARDIAEVAGELEGLRSGLAESEAVSRRVLAQAPTEPPS